MSSSTLSRRPRVQRLGLVGIGTAVLLVGIASPAVAAPASGVVVPLEPSEVILFAVPTENYGPMDAMGTPSGTAEEPVDVEYGDTFTVELPAYLDASAVEAELLYDNDADGVADRTIATTVALTASGTGSTVTVTLPASGGANGPLAYLELSVLPTTSPLGAEYEFVEPVSYLLELGTAVLAPETVTPEVFALSQVPCAYSSGTRCPITTPVTAGSTFVLDLTTNSALRDLGLTSLAGLEVLLQQFDANGVATSVPPVSLPVTISGSTATVTIPAGTSAGSYGLAIGLLTPSGASVIEAELVVAAPAAATTTAAPTAAPSATPAVKPAVNAGLRSNTGVEVVESGSTGTVAVAAGAGMLLLAGTGGVALARGRRRPAAEGGTCEL